MTEYRLQIRTYKYTKTYNTLIKYVIFEGCTDNTIGKPIYRTDNKYDIKIKLDLMGLKISDLAYKNIGIREHNLKLTHIST